MFAEATAQKYGFTREMQVNLQPLSLMRAQVATQNNNFVNEIVPITVKSGKTETVIEQDEKIQ